MKMEIKAEDLNLLKRSIMNSTTTSSYISPEEQGSEKVFHRLKDEYSKNGHKFKLLKRTNSIAMFVQMNGNTIIAYEVGKIRSDKGRVLEGRTIEPGERFWSNEDIGRIAKSFVDIKDALSRFDELQNEPSKTEKNQ
jgi:hypothetical protein